MKILNKEEQETKLHNDLLKKDLSKEERKLKLKKYRELIKG